MLTGGLHHRARLKGVTLCLLARKKITIFGRSTRSPEKAGPWRRGGGGRRRWSRRRGRGRRCRSRGGGRRSRRRRRAGRCPSPSAPRRSLPPPQFLSPSLASPWFRVSLIVLGFICAFRGVLVCYSTATWDCVPLSPPTSAREAVVRLLLQNCDMTEEYLNGKLHIFFELYRT